MVKIMKNPIKMDDLGGPPLFLETSICYEMLSWCIKNPEIGTLLLDAYF